MMAIILAVLLGVVNTTNTSVSCACQVTTCSINFPYQKQTDLTVTSTTPGNVVTTLTYQTNYTLSVVSTQTTAVLTLTAPASTCPAGNTLKISRVLPLTQPQNLSTQTAYQPQVLMQMADRLAMQIQQINSGVVSAVTVLGPGLIFADSPILGDGSSGSHLHWDFTAANTWTATQTFAPTASNTNAITATGNGTGVGVSGTGGATNAAGVSGTGTGTAAGVLGTGGGTSGAGVSGTGGTTNGVGLSGQGTGSGAGVAGVGGSSSGPGVTGTGGSTNGVGGSFTGVGTGSGSTSTSGGGINSNGAVGLGTGTNPGVLGAGLGAQSHCLSLITGTCTGPGVVGNGSTTNSGPGGVFVGQGSNYGVAAYSGSAATAAVIGVGYGGLPSCPTTASGACFVGGTGSGAANGDGSDNFGQGSGAGSTSTGGTTGDGADVTSGGTGGYGVKITQSNTANAHMGMNPLTSDPSTKNNGDLWVAGAGSAMTPKAYLNGTVQPYVTRGPNGASAIQTVIKGTGCTTSAGAAGGTCNDTMTWGTAFPDASYRVWCTIDNAAYTGVPVLVGVSSILAATFVVTTAQLTAVNAGGGELSCIGIHN